MPRFRVSTEDAAPLVPDDAAEALLHGARNVYLSPSAAPRVLERLGRGEPVAWSYGFSSVDIEPL